MDFNFNILNLLLHIPNFVSPKECQFLINHFEKNIGKTFYESASDSTENNQKLASFRSYAESNVTCDAYNIMHYNTQKIIDLYHEHLDNFNMFHEAFKRQLLFSHSHRILKYETGSSLHDHVDHLPFCYGSCVINLNENYDGGEFAFFRNKYRIKLKEGDALIFPADFFWVHEVLPVTGGVRYSTNSFLLSVPHQIQKQCVELSYSLVKDSPLNYLRYKTKYG